MALSSAVVTSCRVSWPKSPSVARLARPIARRSLFGADGRARIFNARSRVVVARTSSGRLRSFAICSAIGFS